MKTLTFAALLLVVAVGSYTLGRKRVPAPAPAPSVVQATTNLLAQTNSQIVTVVPKPSAKSTLPFANNLTAAQRGFEAAELDIAAALKQIDALPVSERMGFIHGIFSFVARNQSPAEALKTYERVGEAHRPNALRALVAEWIDARSPLDADARYLKREGTLTINGSRQGLEVELSNMLASAKLDPELMGAWLDAFSTHSSRSEILATFAGQFPRENPEALLSRIDQWTAWEKERATRGFLWSWASEKPQEAWDWYQSQRGRFDQDLSSSILNAWAMTDPDALKGLLTTVSDPTQRQTIIETIGRTLGLRNTTGGVEWADSLADANERAAAHRVVYDNAPRGIGAVLDYKNGFPTLRSIIPGSPLDGTGALPGDQFIELRSPDGSAQPLYGRDLATAVNLIRGEPGTEMTLRILRQNSSSGSLEELFIPVKRGQLYINEKMIPKTATP